MRARKLIEEAFGSSKDMGLTSLSGRRVSDPARAFGMEIM
jgi:hypothetical protein